MQDISLAHALGFGDDDLEANRSGHLSPRQQRRLNRRILVLNIIYWGGAVFFFICAMYLEPWAYGARHPLFWVSMFIIVLAGVGLWWMLGESEAFTSDVHNGSVAQISGFVRCKFSEWTRGIEGGGEYYIEVIGQRFWVPYAAYDAFDEQLKYTIYYLPTVRKVIAAEPASWG